MIRCFYDLDLDRMTLIYELALDIGLQKRCAFPWDSLGNGNSFGLPLEMGMGIAYFIGEK